MCAGGKQWHSMFVRSVTRGAQTPAPRGARGRSAADCISSPTLNAPHSFARMNERRLARGRKNYTETVV